jgi:hypothetical protein
LPLVGSTRHGKNQCSRKIATALFSWCRPLAENDFDFEIHSDEQKRYLELQEIIIPGKKRGSPYTPGEQVINPAKFARTITEIIASKGLHYARRLTQPLDLLVYVTHWRFLPSIPVLQLVAYELRKSGHPYWKIYYFARHDSSSGHTSILYPNTEIIAGIVPDQLAQRTYVNFDPGSAAPFKDGNKIGVRLNLTPDAMKKFGFNK